MENASEEIVFVLHGLNETQTNKQIYFAFALMFYLLTIFANLTLVVTIALDKMLHKPMYILLCNLCINGIYGASSFYPKILADLLSDVSVISYTACLTQICIIYSYAFCEFTSLTVMAYDRYVAICKPLQYHSIMTTQKVVHFLIIIWLFSLSESIIGTVLTSRLTMCGFDIGKLYCSNWAVVKLSCIDTTLNNIYGFVLTFSHLSQFVLILISYVHIIRASLQSQAGRRKFMQTCLPHLITIIIFTMSLTFDVMYARYGSSTSLQPLRNIMSIEFLVVPPLINPIIYGIKLTEIRNKVVQMFNHKIDVMS